MDDLFGSQEKCPFEVGDILQLKDGFNMNNTMSRVLVRFVEASSVGITAGLFRNDDMSPVMLPVAWISISEAAKSYVLYKRKKA